MRALRELRPKASTAVGAQELTAQELTAKRHQYDGTIISSLSAGVRRLQGQDNRSTPINIASSLRRGEPKESRAHEAGGGLGLDFLPPAVDVALLAQAAAGRGRSRAQVRRLHDLFISAVT